ncbi:MAG TPA: hypothetical protein PLN69_01005 [bacterium]|nr:hypothetical protein [bacterium]
MKRADKINLSVLVVLCVILSSAFAFAETRNITEENKKALANVVETMQQTEMMRVSRGRLKSNPVIYPFHTIYQNLIQNQNYLIKNHTESYANALSRLLIVREDFLPDAVSGKGKIILDYYKRELIRQYDLAPQFETVKTLLETNDVLERSRAGLDAIPIRARLAFDARRWAFVCFGSEELPEQFESRLDSLMREWKPAKDVFEVEESISELSLAYSELFVEISGEKGIGK